MDVYGALVDYIRANIDGECWLNREPEQTTAFARALPYTVVEGKFTVEHNFETYIDGGPVSVHCYAVGGPDAKEMALKVRELFQDPASWPLIPVADGEFVKVLVTGYELVTEDRPDKDGNVVYRFQTDFDVEVSGI